MENECFYKPLCLLGSGGIIIWIFVLCFFIYTKIQQKRPTKKINLQWIENREKKTKHPISKLIADLEKASQVFKKFLKLQEGLIVFFSLSFLVRFLLKGPYNEMALSGLVLAGICMPMWLHTTLLITAFDDRRKRIIEVMKETRSEQQCSLSEAGERNRTEMKDI